MLHDLIPRLLAAERFTAPGVRLAIASGSETIPWEMFQGRLLPIPQTRQQRTFESWNVHVMLPDGPSPEPVVSVKVDGRVYVVRGVECDVWEGEGEGVIEAARRRRWVRELVADLPADEHLEEELTLALERAFTGTALPLMPHESPHPLYSFGLLAYQPPGPFDSHRLEFLVRSIDGGDIGRVAEALAEAFTAGEVMRLLKRLFLGVSLSPWTAFVPRLFTLIERSHLTPYDQAAFQAWLLTLVCRHLTAYDLITFHHRGANYPDALLLDESLSRLLALLRRDPALADRPVRRALRQAFLLRRSYEGHPVPDAPTSPGEQERVHPAGHPRVPDEQMSDVRARLRKLFTEPSGITPLLSHQAVADLDEPEELEELGAAVYLDRPLGVGKAAVEPDATPALATLAFSRTLATARLHMLKDAGLIDAARLEALRARLDFPGVPLSAVGPAPHQATVSLADAGRVAPDFVLRRTVPGSLRRLLSLFDWATLPTDGWEVVTLVSSGRLMIHGPMIELEIDMSQGYASRRGVEYPAAGLRAVSVGGRPADVAVRPRDPGP